jgi:hypothetical protein
MEYLRLQADWVSIKLLYKMNISLICIKQWLMVNRLPEHLVQKAIIVRKQKMGMPERV